MTEFSLLAAMQHPRKLPFVALGAFLCLLITATLFHRASDSAPAAGLPDAGSPPAASFPGGEKSSDTRPKWEFEHWKHANSHVLSREQCDIAFPKLYQPINDAVEARKSSPIRLEEIEVPAGRCMFRAMIHGGSLYVVDAGEPEKCYVPNGRERIMASLNLFQRAVASSPETLEDIEFTVSYDDIPTRSDRHGVKWGLTRKADTKDVWLFPDYAYWSWNFVKIPSWNEMVRKIDEVNEKIAFSQKKPQAVWRGKISSAPKIRQKLVDVSKGKPWSDIKDSSFSDENNSNFLTMEQLCDYMFLVQTEGTSYSGRLKYLQLCNSVIVSHKLDWQEFHTHLMQPDGPEQNFVETQRDWSDLPSKIEFYLSNQKKAEAIAQRSYETFNLRYLTPAAITCYLRRLFAGWAEVQGYTPELYTLNETSGERTPRGVPFEVFAVTFPEDPSKIL